MTSMAVPDQRTLIARALQAKADLELACREFEDIKYEWSLGDMSAPQPMPPDERVKLVLLSPLLLLALITLVLFEAILFVDYHRGLFKRRRQIRADLAEELRALDSGGPLPNTLEGLWYRYGSNTHSAPEELEQAVLTRWLGLLYPRLPDPLALIEERLDLVRLGIRKFELALREMDSSACVSRSGCLNSVVEDLSAELGPWTTPVTPLMPSTSER